MLGLLENTHTHKIKICIAGNLRWPPLVCNSSRVSMWHNEPQTMRLFKVNFQLIELLSVVLIFLTRYLRETSD